MPILDVSTDVPNNGSSTSAYLQALKAQQLSSEGPGVFTCKTCGKIYRWKRTLQYHIRFECGKEPKFQCPYCPLRSKRKGNITAHIKYLHQKPV